MCAMGGNVAAFFENFGVASKSCGVRSTEALSPSPDSNHPFLRFQLHTCFNAFVSQDLHGICMNMYVRIKSSMRDFFLGHFPFAYISYIFFCKSSIQWE
jgi:hypothetical protein